MTLLGFQKFEKKNKANKATLPFICIPPFTMRVNPYMKKCSNNKGFFIQETNQEATRLWHTHT